MADTTTNAAVQISVNVKEQGGSVKSIKTELREAKAEAIEMARKFGETSTQAQDAAKKVAKLRDEVEDLGIRIKGVNPDKFERIASLGQGVAQGFVAAQGAMALFGSESEDLNKTMIKLQGAIAFSQGLQGLKDLELAFGGLGKSAMQAFKAIAAGISSTGIGLIIIGLGAAIAALIYYWDDLTSTVEDNSKELQRNADFMAANKKAMDELADADTKYAKWKREENSNRINRLAEEALQSKANQEARVQLMKDGMAKELEQQRLNFMAKGTQMLNDHVDGNLIEAINAKERQDIRNKYADAAVQAEIDQAVQNQNARVKIYENEQKEIKDKAEWKKNEAIKDSAELSAILDAEIQSQIDEDKQATENNKALYMQRVQLVHDSLQAISDITSLFANKNEKDQKRVFEIQKAVSMAQTIISTIEAAQAAYKNALTSPISKLMPDGGISLAVAAAGIATAAGLAKLKRIKDTKFQSSSAPTNPSGNGGSSYNSPSINPTTNQQRQIVGNTTGATGNQTQTNDIKVYVTETDISSRQGRVDEIRRRALVK
jgi:hypothetical protein